jgi:hypothetical protein
MVSLIVAVRSLAEALFVGQLRQHDELRMVDVLTKPLERKLGVPSDRQGKGRKSHTIRIKKD